jgi:hypothetical protein
MPHKGSLRRRLVRIKSAPTVLHKYRSQYSLDIPKRVRPPKTLFGLLNSLERWAPPGGAWLESTKGKNPVIEHKTAFKRAPRARQALQGEG